MEYIIQIEDSAFMQMHLAALEAYLGLPSVKSKSLRLETLGLLWGHEVRLAGEGKRLYSVQHVSVDLHATRSMKTVEPSPHDYEIKRNVIASFWPHLEFLGDFHTHPYGRGSSVVTHRGWEYSRKDYRAIEENSEDCYHQNYRVGLVMTIAGLERKSNQGASRLSPQTWEWTMGNLRFWLTAYVTIPVFTAENQLDGLYFAPRGSKAPRLKVRDHAICLPRSGAVRLELPRFGGFTELTKLKRFRTSD